MCKGAHRSRALQTRLPHVRVHVVVDSEALLSQLLVQLDVLKHIAVEAVFDSVPGEMENKYKIESTTVYRVSR